MAHSNIVFNSNSATFSFEAIGTHWQIDILDSFAQAEYESTYRVVRERIELFESTYSRFREDSLIDQIAKNAGVYKLPLDGKIVFDLYQKLYQITHGSVTPLIGNTLVEAGYDKQYSLQKGELTPPPAWEEVLDYHFPMLTIKKPTQLDFGACGKGYLVDIVSTLLRDRGMKSFCVDAGGDMYYAHEGKKTMEVGLEHPENKEEIIGIINILDQSLCGSSGNRRRWAGMHHIVNPHTQTSPSEILAVWAIAPKAIITDAMTTALFFTDPVLLKKEFDFEYAMMMRDYSLVFSRGFHAKFFE